MDSHVETQHGPGGAAGDDLGDPGLEDGVDEGKRADQGDLKK